MNKSPLINLLSDFEHSPIYFGPQGFAVYKTSEALEQAQLEFNFKQNNEQSTNVSCSDKDVSQASWQVIGLDLELGDPYFVDINDANLAVYTAMPSETHWEAQSVAPTLKGFLASLSLLAKASTQVEEQIIPDETTIINEVQLQTLKDQLIAASSAEDFWDSFFENYIIWLFDEE